MIHPIHPTLENQLQALCLLQELKQKAIRKSPPGTLRISKSNNCAQYFHIKESSNGKGEYITSKKRHLAQLLAQKDYDNKMLPLIESEINLIQQFLRKSQEPQIFNLYRQLHPARQALVEPIALTDDEYAKQWQAESYPKKEFLSDVPEHFTAKGERVRSKSEVIIADTLTRLTIPYRYEAPLKLKTKQHHDVTLHPDFTCLNKRTRREFIWEHFGMMDNPDYACQAVERERLYASSGYIFGINFIATTETTSLPLNTPYVEQLAMKLLL